MGLCKTRYEFRVVRKDQDSETTTMHPIILLLRLSVFAVKCFYRLEESFLIDRCLNSSRRDRLCDGVGTDHKAVRNGSIGLIHYHRDHRSVGIDK